MYYNSIYKHLWQSLLYSCACVYTDDGLIEVEACRKNTGEKWLFLIHLQSVRSNTVHSIIFWEKSSHGVKDFKIWNNAITGCISRDSCWFFWGLKNITSLIIIYTYIFLLFVANRRSKFKLSSNVYNKNLISPASIKFIIISKRT